MRPAAARLAVPASLTLLLGCQALPPGTLSPSALPPAGTFAAGELLVALEPGRSEALLREAGTEPVELLADGLWRVAVPAGAEAEAHARLSRMAGIRYAEANRLVKTQMIGGFRPIAGDPEPGNLSPGYRTNGSPQPGYRLAATVTDPRYKPPTGTALPGQWGLDQIKAPQAWDTTQGAVTVAVIDTGIDATHEDLAGNLAMDKAANFVEKGAAPADDFGHGTHVAGIIGAVAGNGVGIAGVAPKVTLIPIRVLGVDGGTTAAVIQGIHHAVSKGAKVINLSLGASQASQAEQDAVNAAVRAGVTVVAAAGNEALNGNPLSYPAALSGVISVAALGRIPVSGQMLLGRAEYSCFNPFVTISAPGSDILSTVPARFGNASNPSDPTKGGAYAYASGTSMAAPMVSGVAALILSRHPDWKPSQVLQALRDSASPAGLLRMPGDTSSGYDANFFGAGLIDAATAVSR